MQHGGGGFPKYFNAFVVRRETLTTKTRFASFYPEEEMERRRRRQVADNEDEEAFFFLASPNPLPGGEQI